LSVPSTSNSTDAELVTVLQEDGDMEIDEHGSLISLEPIVGLRVIKVLLSMHVMKWINQPRSGQNVLREIFVKRVGQLAKGYQSYCTQKVLQGSGGLHLWEAKLTKSDRILYSRVSTCTDELAPVESILVWYVCKHKAVSTLVELIRDSYRRRNLETNLWSETNEVFEMAKGNLLLVDPAGNNMLRTYSVHDGEISRIGLAGWKPQLQLTYDELQIVRASSSVLLLGRVNYF
jgi:hypothetical protein